MEAEVKYEFHSGVTKVWFYEVDRVNRKTRFVQCAGLDLWKYVEVSDGAEVPEPSLTLRGDMLKALVEKGSDVLPPSGQMAEHLKDACAIRDRLLTIVERQV